MSKLAVNINNYLLTINKARLNKYNLIWLFEAISNSIFSLQESEDKNKKRILIEFKEDQISLMNEEGNFFLSDVVITDNGVGFNNDRYLAFSELNTSFNKNNGGKGSGRMTYFLYFNECIVSSIFKENGKTIEREFIANKKEWINHTEKKIVEKEMKTILLFKQPIDEIELNIKDICRKIIMYFLLYFVDGLFDISIDVLLGTNEYNLNKIYEEELKSRIKNDEVKIGEFNFLFTSLKLPIKFLEKNKFFMFAHKREVENIKINAVTEIRKFDINDSINNDYYNLYVGVSSIFFDNNVNQYRNEIKFKIIEENQNVNLFNIEKINYKDEITKKIYDILDKYFKEEIIEVNKDKTKKIESFLKLNENKIYKNLWRDKEIKKDIINLSESKINDNTKLKLELFKIQLKNEKMINDDINHKINDIDFQNKDILFEQLKRKRNIDNITVEKLIIARLEDLKYFEKLILSKRNNKCVLEEDIHEFLCETGKTGEIENIKNRLWILDEGLFFKKTISSDVSLTRNQSVKNIKSQKRPDIYITKSINNNEPDNVISDGRIVIFEIKRPELNNHDKSNDPNEQLLKYYDLVANGKRKAYNGRPLNIKNKAFYELISICDITEKYKQKLIYEKYIEEDSRGAYHKIFLEKNIFSSTLSFDYILEKAKERYSYLNKKDYSIKKEED